MFTAQLRASGHVRCLRLPQRRLLEMEEYNASVLERQAALTLEQICCLFYLKRAPVKVLKQYSKMKANLKNASACQCFQCSKHFTLGNSKNHLVCLFFLPMFRQP